MPRGKRLNIDCAVPVSFFFIHLELYISSLMFNLIFENTLRVYIGFVKTLDKWRMERHIYMCEYSRIFWVLSPLNIQKFK